MVATRALWLTRVTLVVFLAVLLGATPAAIGADAKEEFERLRTLSNEQFAAHEFKQMEQTAIQMRKLAEGPLKDDEWFLAVALGQQGIACSNQYRLKAAEQLSRRALAIQERLLGPEHPIVATAHFNLAIDCCKQGRFSEAEPCLQRALSIHERASGPEHQVQVACILHELASFYGNLGRYAEAEIHMRRCLAIREKLFGADTVAGSRGVAILAGLYLQHGRDDDDERLLKRAIAVREKDRGLKDPMVAPALINLGRLYRSQGRFAEAEGLVKRGIAIIREAWGAEDQEVPNAMYELAVLYRKQKRYVEAEEVYEQILEIDRKMVGDNHFCTAIVLQGLADLYFDEGRLAEAEGLVNRALPILDRTGVLPRAAYESYHLRAQIRWKQGRHPEALADMKRAFDLAESQRAHAAGAEQEMASFFARFADAYERMVAWQAELSDFREALDAMERSRGRSFVEQMELHGMDLLAGLPRAEADRLRSRETEARARALSLEGQLGLVDRDRDLTPEERKADHDRLAAELDRARREYVDAYADIRHASPAYRLAVSMDRKPAPLDRVRQWAAAQDALVLEYLLGEEDGYVLVIGADSAVRLERLAATGKQAQVLEIDMGPLTAKRFKGACSSEQQSGVLQRLRKPGTAEQASGAGTALAELWQLLIPESERKAILADKYRRVIVIPDGLLTQLPFEMLVVKPGEAPQYLLDAGPPILYAPSATILMNLVERKGATTTSSRPPVLTIGDCQYGRPSPKVNDESILAELAPGSRYGRLGGHLQPLPHAAKEIRWVSDVFGKKGVDVAWLQQDWATEKTVRYNVSDRRIVHFACHGLVDQEYGNLFGALALTRGPKPDDPADDGFLTLAEIYELNLKGCELAILSACDTNVGPQQRGEGVWALSRGFLVAGARRVVASNWLVDDEAAASLVSYFCSIIAKAESEGKTPDYAEALWKAKRWVRSQEKWKSPYYWAPFVLIGPD